MENCCENKACEVSALREAHRRVLFLVLAINALMFIVEIVAGLYAGSSSLLADSLDMLGDALVFGFSLFVLEKSARWQVSAAFAKGMLMLLFGLGVLIQTMYKIMSPTMPGVVTMVVIATSALLANLTCFYVLYSHRADNLNMSSTWLCARNDLIANLGVVLAAAASYLLATGWPDVVVGLIIAALFLRTACGIVRESGRALLAPKNPVPMSKQTSTEVGRKKESDTQSTATLDKFS